MKFREPYNFKINDAEGEEEDGYINVDAPNEEVYENEEEIVSGEGAPTEEEEVELDESLPMLDFTLCTTGELVEFMLDFFDLADEDELFQFCVINLAAAAAEAEEEAEIAAWAEEITWMRDVDHED
ncbi:hypothetical protein ALC60_12861 [Trachymyrmex zeteki]|uniref:Uncharacterized protein n=1 Tax=Mycetomoellerius zeteki TaxID=64791 RepID=A0A151WJQ3_9HYME|nr:hypothetical protein ALC60_12861 [Trachymyrmex zeteki]